MSSPGSLPQIQFADGRPAVPSTAQPTFVSDTFCKIYATILDSSVWAESAETRIVWFTLLFAADSYGVVRAAVGGLARRANISREACEKALMILSSPDPDSRSPEFEGRRVERVEGGWLCLNHRKYRETRTESQVRNAARQKKWREDQAHASAGADGSGKRG